jgi:hypothetical protein
MAIELTAPEHEQMAEAGTTLVTIAEPVPYDREKVPHPAHVPLNLDRPKDVLEQTYQHGERWPLPAGLGRYIMLGSCGNLKTLMGWEYCSIYEDRPRACHKLQMGGMACRLIRQEKRVDPPEIKL